MRNIFPQFVFPPSIPPHGGERVSFSTPPFLDIGDVEIFTIQEQSIQILWKNMTNPQWNPFLGGGFFRDVYANQPFDLEPTDYDWRALTILIDDGFTIFSEFLFGQWQPMQIILRNTCVADNPPVGGHRNLVLYEIRDRASKIILCRWRVGWNRTVS